VPLDPWGLAYQYKSPGEHGEFDLLSFGKDGQPGGTDEAADITNW
jgi:general secretion pathway protein G